MHTLIPHTGETDRQVDLWVLGYPVIHSEFLSQKTDTYIQTDKHLKEREREKEENKKYIFFKETYIDFTGYKLNLYSNLIFTPWLHLSTLGLYEGTFKSLMVQVLFQIS